MKIITLIENQNEDRKDLYREHGLSIYIEVDNKKILFDTGQSGNFIDNAKKLDLNLKELDYVIISHGHYDHSGGFERLIEEINPNIKLFVGRGFFEGKYSLIGEEYHYIGNPFDKDFLRVNNIQVNYITKDITNIGENLFIISNFNRKKEFENTNEDMYLKKDGQYVKDEFVDEISLAIKSEKGLIVLVGCAHPGIVNILDTIIERTKMKVHSLIGGTHLVKEDDEKINKIIEYIKDQNVETIGACHCTGRQGETMFSQQLEEKFIKNNTGDILSFN